MKTHPRRFDMATTSIRIGRTTHERLKQVAEKEHSSLGGAIDELLDRYEQEEFRRAVYEGFRGLREDPAEWEAYKRMVAPWDATLLDGLEDELVADIDE
jgi:hypothetical protein